MALDVGQRGPASDSSLNSMTTATTTEVITSGCAFAPDADHVPCFRREKQKIWNEKKNTNRVGYILTTYTSIRIAVIFMTLNVRNVYRRVES